MTKHYQPLFQSLEQKSSSSSSLHAQQGVKTRTEAVPSPTPALHQHSQLHRGSQESSQPTLEYSLPSGHNIH